ncbi:MAG: hypothetical protein Q9170_005266 [Blastenia crenularia]
MNGMSSVLHCIDRCTAEETAPSPIPRVRRCTIRDPSNCASDRGGFFNKNQSSTWKDEGLYELDQELNLGYTGNGNFGLDSIALGYPGSRAITVEQQMLATIAAKDFYIATWGIAPRPTNLSRSGTDETTFAPGDLYQSLLSTLKEKSGIPSLSYGYTAGARYRLKRVLASLTFGGYDASRFEPSNLTFSLANDNSRDLVVGVKSISIVGSSHELLPNPILAFIDATISHIWLPLEACLVFEAVFGIRWDPITSLYLVNETAHQTLLNQNASIVFAIGADTLATDTLSITFPYASFDLEVLDTYPNVTNSTRYFPLKRAANDTQYTLGRTFLQETYLIADYERSQFSINQCRFVEDTPADIHPIFPVNNTNNSNTSNSHDHPNVSSLSPGVIAAITIAAVFLFGTVAIALTVRYRRKHRKSVADPSPSPEIKEVPPIVDFGPEQELHGEGVPPPELHGASLGPSEMEDGVAAIEMDAAGEDRYELSG